MPNNVLGNFADGAQLYQTAVEALRSPLLRLQLLSQMPDADSSVIKEEASGLLRTLDALLLINQTALSQQQLEITPVGLASVFDDVLHVAQPMLKARNVVVENRISRSPVLAHREATILAGEQLLRTMCELCIQSSKTAITVHSRTYADRTDFGIYGTDLQLRAGDVQSFRRKSTSFPRDNNQSRLHYLIADNLLALQGSRLRSSIFQGNGGLAFSLNKSHQLSLIA